MTTPVCASCDAYIETSNLRWPGYCSARCRDGARRRFTHLSRRRRARLLGISLAHVEPTG